MLHVGFLVNPKTILWYHVRSFLWPIRMITFHLVSGMIVSFYYYQKKKTKNLKNTKEFELLCCYVLLILHPTLDFTIPTSFEFHSNLYSLLIKYYELLWISLLKYLCIWSFLSFEETKRFKNLTDWFEQKQKLWKSETQMNRFKSFVNWIVSFFFSVHVDAKVI